MIEKYHKLHNEMLNNSGLKDVNRWSTRLHWTKIRAARSVLEISSPPPSVCEPVCVWMGRKHIGKLLSRGRVKSTENGISISKLVDGTGNDTAHDTQRCVRRADTAVSGYETGSKRLLCVVSTRFVSSLMVVNGCEWISSESKLISIHFSFSFRPLRPPSTLVAHTIRHIHLSASWIRQCKQFSVKMPWMLMWMWC